VVAVQGEGLSRKKHEHDFPVHAIQDSLNGRGIGPRDLEDVGFCDMPIVHSERVLTLPSKEAGIQAVDGAGEWSTATWTTW